MVLCPQAQAGDYLSKIAIHCGIRLEKLLLDNIEQLDNLDTPVVGKLLLLCNPRAGEPAAG
jgi:hypothetical protein